MLKIDFHLVIYRYEIIVAFIVLLLTGSIVVSSKDFVQDFAFQNPRYPHKIALTFDDGPHPYYTDKLIDVLAENKVHATFFIVGRMAMEYPQLIEELSVAGHELEVHGFLHKNLTKLSDEGIEKELGMARSVIEDISGKKCLFYRPPGGQYNERVKMIADSMGQAMVLWFVFPKDHEEENPDIIIKRVLEQASDGGVVLMHSGRVSDYSCSPGNNKIAKGARLPVRNR